MKALLQPVLIGFVFVGVAAIAADFPILEEPTLHRQQQLRQLLLQDCSVCHGKLLKGDLGPPLNAKSLAPKSEQELVRTIIQGHEETAMPTWVWTLEEHEARWLVRYIRRSGN